MSLWVHILTEPASPLSFLYQFFTLHYTHGILFIYLFFFRYCEAMAPCSGVLNYPVIAWGSHLFEDTARETNNGSLSAWSDIIYAWWWWRWQSDVNILRGDGHDFAVKDLLNCTVELDGYRTTALIEACDIFINPNGTYTMRNGTSIHT